MINIIHAIKPVFIVNLITAVVQSKSLSNSCNIKSYCRDYVEAISFTALTNISNSSIVVKIFGLILQPLTFA